MDEQPTIWALKIQPNSADDDAIPYEFCKQHDPPIIGTGWGLDKRYDSPEAALSAHKKVGNTSRSNVRFSIRGIVQIASVGDFVWINEGSEYALCRIESDWKQQPVAKDRADGWTKNDIHNYREATWEVIDPEFVPGYVKRYFASPQTRTFSRPKGGKNNSSKRYAREVFQENPSNYDDILDLHAVRNLIEDSDVSNIFDLLGPIETEDVVIDHLQSEGWHVVKSSTSRAQPGIECVLRRAVDEPEAGYVQVKTGSASVNFDQFRGLSESATVFIHQFEEPEETLPAGMKWISPTEVANHLGSNTGLMPPHLIKKLEIGLKRM